MTIIRKLLLNQRATRTIDFFVLILAVLLVPYTHGYLQYFGLIAAALLLITAKYLLFRSINH